jgi:competence protein ComEA
MRLPSLLAGLLGGILASGLLLLLISEPRGHPIRLMPPPTAGPILVHVAGAVRTPGVYALAAGSRLEDALDAAGGPAARADLGALNLAGRLEDGERVLVPLISPTPAPGEAGEPAAEHQGLLDINSATTAQLETLPGIGPVLAASIVEYRETYGAFARLEDLLRVPGIGPAKLEQLRPYIALP